MDNCLKHYEDQKTVENEWNIKKYITENSRRELIKYKVFTQNGKRKIGIMTLGK